MARVLVVHGAPEVTTARLWVVPGTIVGIAGDIIAFPGHPGAGIIHRWVVCGAMKAAMTGPEAVSEAPAVTRMRLRVAKVASGTVTDRSIAVRGASAVTSVQSITSRIRPGTRSMELTVASMARKAACRSFKVTAIRVIAAWEARWVAMIARRAAMVAAIVTTMGAIGTQDACIAAWAAPIVTGVGPIVGKDAPGVTRMGAIVGKDRGS
jgi:hypothetical protein